MAIANPIDFSISSAIACKTRKTPHYSILSHCGSRMTKMPFPFISIFLLNLNSRPVKADSSACSSPVLDPIEDASQVIDHLSVNLQDFPTDADFGEDFKELNPRIIALFKDTQTENLGYDYYQKVKQKPGFKPQRRTLKLVAMYLIRSRNWGSLFSYCEDLGKFRVLPDRSTCCKRIIRTCVKARKFRLVNNFLEAFLANDKETAVLAFDFAMKGYNELHMYSNTCVLHQRMKSGGLDLSPACYSRAMEAHMKMRHFEKAYSVFKEFDGRKMVKKIVDIDMLPIYSRIYCILCESLGKLGRAYEALEYFREMSKLGIPENHSIYSSLVSSFANAGEVGMAEGLLLEAESKNMLKDPALFLHLVLRYIDQGLMEKTLDIVDLMKRVKIRVSDCIFCTIINGFSKKRGLRDGLRVFEDLISRGCEPGQVTYASVLNIYLGLGLYTKGEMVFSEMEQKGFGNCMVAYSSMVAAYGKTGRTRDAMRLVTKMKQRGLEPSVWIYNSLLDMNGKAMNLRQVEKTWKEMKRRKVSPDRVSYTTIIGAYNRAREFETCVRYYEEFKMTGGKMDRAMAGIMVAIFSKTNRVDEIVELLGDMKSEGTRLDERFYRSAMNALRDAGLQVQARWLEEMFRSS